MGHRYPPRPAPGGAPLLWLALIIAAGCDDRVPRCEELSPLAGGEGPSPVTFSVDGGHFFEPFTVSLSAELPGAEIRYTLHHGDSPRAAVDDAVYSGPIEIAETTWLRARALVDGKPVGAVASRAYVALDPALAELESRVPIVLVSSFGYDIDRRWNPELGRPFCPVSAVFLDTEPSGMASTSNGAGHSGHAGMHVRGQSSAEYEKKSYRIELRDERGEDQQLPLLGLPEEADWILQGPFSDKTLMRNQLIYGWSNRIGRYAARTRFVELWYSPAGPRVGPDDHRGVYVLMENIERDKERVAVEKLLPEHDSEPEISGGYLLKKDWWDEEADGTYLITETCEDVLLFEDPRPEQITAAQRNWIAGYLDDFEQALASPSFTDPEDGYRPYIDVGSFIDHMLLVELGRNVDGYVLSTFVHKDRGGKLQMGPVWDYNGALGNADYFDAWEPAGWHYENDEFPADNPTAFAWYERLLDDPAFRAARAERWFEHRAGPWSTAQLLADIDANAALLDEAADRNFDRWDILGVYVWPNPEDTEERHSYEEEVAYLKDWLEERVAWLDEELGAD